MVPATQSYNARGGIRDETKPFKPLPGKVEKGRRRKLEKLMSCLSVETYITLVFHLLKMC